MGFSITYSVQALYLQLHLYPVRLCIFIYFFFLGGGDGGGGLNESSSTYKHTHFYLNY